MPADPAYEIVELANGVRSLRTLENGETFHPVIGPVAEAEALYVRQLNLWDRIRRCVGEFVIWDVGLGAAANVLTVLRAASDLPALLRIISFDRTLEPLRFALEHAEELGYFGELREHAERVASGEERNRFSLGSLEVQWEVRLGDFPDLLKGTRLATGEHEVGDTSLPAPHAIMYDAYSMERNPEMWTLPLFERIYLSLDPHRPCVLPTYSRSTMLRVTLLLSGFHVGVGHATGEKEETTIAANTLDLIDEPLDRAWLDRVCRSDSAEPLHEPVFRRASLRTETWVQLRHHPQFATA